MILFTETHLSFVYILLYNQVLYNFPRGDSAELRGQLCGGATLCGDNFAKGRLLAEGATLLGDNLTGTR